MRLGRTAFAVAMAISMAFPFPAWADIQDELSPTSGEPLVEEATAEGDDIEVSQNSQEDEPALLTEATAPEGVEDEEGEPGESLVEPEPIELEPQATSTARQVYDAYCAVLDEGLRKQFVIIGTHPYSHQSYFIAEVSGDNIPELFVSAETAAKLSVYQYGAINRKAIYIGEVYVGRRLFYHGKDGHTLYNNYRDAVAALDKITASNGSLQITDVFASGIPKKTLQSRLYGSPVDWSSSLYDRSELTPILSMNISPVTTISPRFTFVDTDTFTPHFEDIYWLADKGISEGWKEPDGTRTFRGMAPVVRQDMAAFLYRLAGSPAFTPSAADKRMFSDVNASTPHAKEIWWLAHEKISEGWREADGTRTFRGMETVRRQDMAAFLFRLAKRMGRGGASDWWQPTSSQRSRFNDVTPSTPHAREVWWLAKGVSTGYSDRTFRGGDPVYRQDMAAFLRRLYNL